MRMCLQISHGHNLHTENITVYLILVECPVLHSITVHRSKEYQCHEHMGAAQNVFQRKAKVLQLHLDLGDPTRRAGGEGECR